MTMKKKAMYKTNELSQFCDKMRGLVAEQLQNIELAFVLEAGPYRVIPQYKHLTKSSASWMKLGKISREKHLHHVHTCPIKPLRSIAEGGAAKLSVPEEACSINNESACSSKENNRELSITLQEFGLPSQIFKNIIMAKSCRDSKCNTLELR